MLQKERELPIQINNRKVQQNQNVSTDPSKKNERTEILVNEGQHYLRVSEKPNLE